MPAPYEPQTGRGGRRRLAWLFWTGVGVAPLAALLLVLGQGVGPLRAAAVLAVLSVVLIGLSVTLREDAATVRDEFSEQLRREVDLVRADVDTLRRGVELTVHRELERVHGELEAARRDNVLRAQATQLPRITGELPAPEDFHTVEPIREEYRARPEAGTRERTGSVATAKVPTDSHRGAVEPMRVGAARVDAPIVGSARPSEESYSAVYESSFESVAYEAKQYESARYESTYDGERYETASASVRVYSGAAAAAQPAGPESPATSTGRWAVPNWDAGQDEAPQADDWSPPEWERRSSRYDDSYGERDPQIITGDVLEGTYSLGGSALTDPVFGTGNGFGNGNGFGSSTFAGSSDYTYRDPISSPTRYARADLPALPEGPSSRSDEDVWETTGTSWADWDDKSSWSNPADPSASESSREVTDFDWAESTGSMSSRAAADKFAEDLSADFELPSLDHLPSSDPVSGRHSAGADPSSSREPGGPYSSGW